MPTKPRAQVLEGRSTNPAKSLPRRLIGQTEKYDEDSQPREELSLIVDKREHHTKSDKQAGQCKESTGASMRDEFVWIALTVLEKATLHASHTGTYP